MSKCKSKGLRKDYMARVVKELARLRIAKGISQSELEHKLGVCDHLVAKWECGIRTPSTFNLHCWAMALGASILVAANDNKLPTGDSS